MSMFSRILHDLGMSSWSGRSDGDEDLKVKQMVRF